MVDPKQFTSLGLFLNAPLADPNTGGICPYRTHRSCAVLFGPALCGSGVRRGSIQHPAQVFPMAFHAASDIFYTHWSINPGVNTHPELKLVV